MAFEAPIFRRLVPKRALDRSSANEKSASTPHQELMKKPHRNVAPSACKGACHTVLSNLFALGLVCLAIGFPMKLSSDTERLNWRSDWLIS
jgi:hypothetical protein